MEIFIDAKTLVIAILILIIALLVVFQIGVFKGAGAARISLQK